MTQETNTSAYTAGPYVIVKTYRTDWVGRRARAKVEIDLFNQGFHITRVEEVKEWDFGQACCLGMIFLPLMLLGKIKKIRVTYELK